MKVSVIIPCLNAASTIGEQLEALSAQEFDGFWEVLVADNGSTDGTLDVVAALAPRFSSLEVVDASARRGQAHGKNIAARQARGELLLFTDADDRVADGYLRAMAVALERHEFVACRYEDHALNEDWAASCHANPQREGLNPYTYPDYLPHAGGSSLGVRRELHEEIGGFDESLPALEDTDYCWRLQLAGHDLAFAGDAVVHVRYRHSLKEMFRQAYQYAIYNVLLYKRYRAVDMPKLPWYAGPGSFVKLLLRLPQTASKPGRASWLWQFAWRLGRLVGSVRYRIYGL